MTTPPDVQLKRHERIPGTRVRHPGPEFLSPRDIANTTGLHVAVIRRAIERGELRAHKLCSRIRVRRTDFECWLERSLVRP
jgi:excisionase family DNA binding protein